MPGKWSVVSPTTTMQTIELQGQVAARTKGTPEVLNGAVVFPLDSYPATSAKQVVVLEADEVEIVASGANTDIASVNFLAGQKVYWDAAVSKITNVLTSNTFIGRCKQAADYSGGVAAGAKLVIQFQQVAS